MKNNWEIEFETRFTIQNEFCMSDDVYEQMIEFIRETLKFYDKKLKKQLKNEDLIVDLAKIIRKHTNLGLYDATKVVDEIIEKQLCSLKAGYGEIT